MLIHRVKANQSSFKTVEFQSGFNVVLADRTEVSGKKDSRNGLGKSTLINIIHFCLGAKKDTKNKLFDLKKWSFSLDLTLTNSMVTVTRSIEEYQYVEIEGDTSDWEIQPELKDEKNILTIDRWTDILGNLVFGLLIGDDSGKFSPTFRSLIPYFIRRGKESYTDAFKYFGQQPIWQIQVYHSFLLSLGWEYAQELQHLKEEEKHLANIKKLRKATEEGAKVEIIGNLGELEAFRVEVERILREREDSLRNFHVYPQYSEIEQNANRLTQEIHEATNNNLINQRLLNFYESSLEQENEPDEDNLVNLYNSVGIELPRLAVRRLENVKQFHRTIINNRREFLQSEIERLNRTINQTNYIIREKTEERANLLEILQTHGALEEYTKLQSLYLDSKADLNEINRRIQELRKFEEDKGALKIEKQGLIMRMQWDLIERTIQKDLAISLFNDNSQALYNTPGELIINVLDSGYSFRVNIDRDGSEGIGNMKIFCYDLTLAQIWSEREPSPNILIHDSTIFDGVDERQIALALERVAKESSERGFQYICTFNSDMIPKSEFSEDFDFDSFVRLRLTDQDKSGKLLGISF